LYVAGAKKQEAGVAGMTVVDRRFGPKGAPTGNKPGLPQALLKRRGAISGCMIKVVK